MNELHPFDRNIREKLNDLEVPYGESDWDQFEEKMEQDETVSATDFDKAAADRLSRMEAPYDPYNWDLMAKRIDVAFSFRHWLHRNHVPELVLMILLGFTLIQFFQWESLRQRFAPDAKKQETPVPPQPNTNKPIAATASANPACVGNFDLCYIPEVCAKVEIAQAGQADLTPLAWLPEEPISPVIPEVPVFSAASGFRPLSPLPSLSHTLSGAKLPQLEQYAKGSAMAGISALKRFLVRPTRWYVGAYGGMDYNVIQAPVDEVFQTQGYLTDSVGQRAGVLLAMEKGKWQFQTGAAYTKVAYRPILPEQQYGNFDYLVVESFDEIGFHFLQAPFEIRRNFLPETSRWDIYAFGGIQANVILHAAYGIEKTEILSSRGMEQDLSAQSRLNEKTFPDGILDGDRFFQNAYLSFSGGVGVERSISSRYKIFAEPVYARPFFGHQIGPNDDRIHRFTVQMGIKLQVK
jgi:hypothetical protein